MNVPNFLSFCRIFSVPAFIWLVLNDFLHWALFLFIMAGITDALDGYIAKRFNSVTKLGEFLDPLADKLLITSGFITLTINGLMPLWITLIVVTRDLVIIAGAIVFQVLTGSLKMEPLVISKINTVMQIILIISIMIENLYLLKFSLMTMLLIIVSFTTVLSGVIYIFIWSKRAVEKEIS
ncbi:MAG TPA: CDP-diacylglycerol--glycerol-3-phosphate 3-phosphatidyltransferase [Alphaproteobacteria bacterium]|nr:CDP-diacylglycerol--glycerol-3-phosphate 3-phosphatidyltransferase [Alphaproteobacteria bacterium]